MARTALDAQSTHQLAAIETDTRFFMRLLLGAGIAAAAIVGGGVVWHESELAGGSATPEQMQTQPLSPE